MRNVADSAIPQQEDGPLAASQASGGQFRFELLREAATTLARRGRITTTRGVIETPVFMPVGTQATVKTLHPREVAETGARIILANTYHLMLRPGLDVIREAGGLHAFMGWNGPILTDSGGFQVFSLASNSRVREEGVTFASHIDGSPWTLTPEGAVELQLGYGSDIMMQLDHVLGLPADRSAIADATERSARWLDRAIAAYRELGRRETPSVLFGIQQGGMDSQLRAESARRVGSADVAGCAIGGLSVGEPKPVMAEMLEISTPLLPRAKPRYLMGVGSPEDLWQAVARGVDMFDCVLPTRAARNGGLFTPEGRVTITNSKFRRHHRPVDETCDCASCSQFTAAYIHHLFRANEVLGLRLASVHNLRFLMRQMEVIRSSLDTDSFPDALNAFEHRYVPVSGPRTPYANPHARSGGESSS